MQCKACKRKRKLSKTGFCSECQAKVNLLALYFIGKIFTDPEWTQAFCDDIVAAGEAMRRAMKALQGGNNAE